MSNKNNPEQEKDPQIPETSVDFSDLGPLFAPEETPAEPEIQELDVEEASEDTQDVSFQPLEPQEETVSETQEEEIDFLPLETAEKPQEDAVLPEEPSETPAVDFSDLGPLFEEEHIPVQAGAAAMVLKKLSELPPEEPVSQDESDETAVFTEDPTEEIQAEPSAEISEEEMTAETEDVADPVREETPSKEAEPVENQEDESAQEPVSEEEPEEDSEDLTEEVTTKDEQEPEGEDQEDAAEEEQKAFLKRAMHKGRPKRKKGEGFFGIPNLLVTLVWIAITVLIGVTLGRMVWVCAADVLAFGREDKPVTITVYEADTIEDITRKLHEGGLIKYPGLFKFYASLAVDEGEIHPGIWDLNTRYDYHALVNMMSPSSSREVIELMIPEGYSCRQIFALMEENKICTSLDLGAYAASGELDDYWFLEGVPRGDMYCLEGYLFPDTYQFYKNDSPRAVLTKMLNNFEHRFDEAMIGQIDTLNAHLADLMRKGGHGDDYIAQHLFTIRDVINVASLIEKETSSADEGYVIASVIYNRLFNWPDNVPYLNIDATIVYALGGKNKLTQEDLKVNSPYNTYTHTGLTPGPIANPGLSSIRAALDPSDSNYYYYVLDPALGSHRFSTTYDEHKANIASIGG